MQIKHKPSVLLILWTSFMSGKIPPSCFMAYMEILIGSKKSGMNLLITNMIGHSYSWCLLHASALHDSEQYVAMVQQSQGTGFRHITTHCQQARYGLSTWKIWVYIFCTAITSPGSMSLVATKANSLLLFLPISTFSKVGHDFFISSSKSSRNFRLIETENGGASSS